MSEQTGERNILREDIGLVICRAISGLRWPNVNIGSETHFNRENLEGILKSTSGFEDIQIVEQSTLRHSNALALFGWGAKTRNANISRRVKTDMTFKKGQCDFFIENKLIKKGRECDIKNALVQAVEYLNVYVVDIGIVLLFDRGRGKDIDWGCHPEEKLVKALTSVYPLCIVRVRENQRTQAYYDPQCISNISGILNTRA